MHSIVFLYSGHDDWNDSKPDVKPLTIDTYAYMNSISIHEDIQMIRAHINWFQDGQFYKYWGFNDENTIARFEQPVTPDYVIDKAKYNDNLDPDMLRDNVLRSEINQTALITLNTPEFNRLTRSKLNQYVLFEEDMPKTQILPPGEYQFAESCVIKEFFGSGGKKSK